MINKVILLGNLGRDPEVRYLQTGDAVANLSVATSEKWKDKHSGEMREATEWHRVVVYGKMAEHCGTYLNKGSKVYIEGKIKTRKWQGEDGKDRYTTEVVVDFGGKIKFLDSTPSGNAGTQQQQSAQQPKQPDPYQSVHGTDGFDDDIPF